MTGVELRESRGTSGIARHATRCLALFVIATSIMVGGSWWSLPGTASAADVATCDPVPPSPEVARTINLVLDESGSMFFDPTGKAIDRWSFAKYSLEVFAALMGPNDTLNVYRMSDYGPNQEPPDEPSLTLTGTTSMDRRVALVHDLQLNGGSTPYTSVTTARDDLIDATQSQATRSSWLIVLTDGEFYDASNRLVPTETVNRDLRDLCKDGISVAFMSIGPTAPTIEGGNCIEFVKTTNSTDLIGQMTKFSNTIFNRAIASDAGTSWDLDIPLKEVKIFAQGPNVSVGDVATSEGSVSASDIADVSWTENPDLVVDGEPFTAVPNRALKGVVATFEDIPAGPISLDISNYKDLAYFYKPAVNFGAVLTDSSGQVIGEADAVAGQSYTINYGLMNDSCEFIESALLGDVTYDAVLRQDGKKVQGDIQPGDAISFPEGNVVLDISARASGLSAAAQVGLTSSSPIPDAPVSIFAAPGDSAALVSWDPPAYTGGGEISSYTVTSDPPGASCTTDGALSCQVTGLENGVTYTFTVTATSDFGNEGSPSPPSNPVTPFASISPDYRVSTMAEFPPDDRGMRVALYVVTDGGQTRPITPEEWAALDASSIQTATDGSIEFEVRKLDQVGDLLLLPRAPDGDIYAATTGPQEVTVTLPANDRLNFKESSVSIPFNVIDDISAWDRWRHWFFTTGLKLLIGLILLIILLGYVFKKRFPNRIKKGPMINGRPRVIGPQAINAPGRFQKNSLRQVLPFLADKATLTYVPFGVMGFAPLQLKAGSSKMLKLENWRQIAAQGNVQINGVTLDDSTTTQPVFHAGAPITAETAQMIYDMSATQ